MSMSMSWGGGGSGGGAGGGDLVGAGVVDEVDLAVGVAPDHDAVEGLANGPASVGLDAVREPAERDDVGQPGGPVLLQGRLVGGDVGLDVVGVDPVAEVPRPGGGLGGGAQPDRAAVPVGQLVGVDRGQPGDVEDGLDGVGVQGS